MNSVGKSGFTYLVEVIKDGAVVESEIVRNLIPIEGVNYILNTALKNGSPNSSWYIGLYEGAYTPLPSDTAATLPGASTESTAYSETTRVPLTLGAVVAGSTDNSASTASFTFTADKIINGGFISSLSAKGGTTGVIISAVKFASPKSLSSGSILRVTAGIQIISG